MKMVLVVYNISVEEEVQDVLRNAGVPCFTQWPRLLGKGVSTGPRMDTSVWPGANSALMTVVEEAKARELLQAFQSLREGAAAREGVKAFLLDVEAMTGDP
ncbi:MAG: PG0541 family transporter-associated protein [Oligosphaeraceae bacterium]